MSDLKTRVRPFPNTVVSLLLLATAALIAGQAVFSAEAGAQSASASVPSTEQRALDDATSRAIYGQRYIGLYDGDDFIGDHAVTKEELLLIVDRMLRDIEAGKILVESSDAELLRTVVVEFQEKLMDLNNRVQVLDAEMQVRHKRDVVLTEQTLQVKEEANDLMAKITTFARIQAICPRPGRRQCRGARGGCGEPERFDERIDEIVLEIGDLQASFGGVGRRPPEAHRRAQTQLSVTTSRFGTLRTETLSIYDTLVSRMMTSRSG